MTETLVTLFQASLWDAVLLVRDEPGIGNAGLLSGVATDTSRSSMPIVLILAYGNPLRSDDGVAWRAAEILETKFDPSAVEILRLHQLTPELADTLRNFRFVIFVDAASSDTFLNQPGIVRVEEIDGNRSEPARFSHVLSPKKVLDLAAQLYDASPRAFCVTVGGDNFNHGDSLSPAVAEALPELVAQITVLVQKSL